MWEELPIGIVSACGQQDGVCACIDPAGREVGSLGSPRTATARRTPSGEPHVRATSQQPLLRRAGAFISPSLSPKGFARCPSNDFVPAWRICDRVEAQRIPRR